MVRMWGYGWMAEVYVGYFAARLRIETREIEDDQA